MVKFEPGSELLPEIPADKPGWKTTEFWLSLAAVAFGLLQSSGAIGEGTLGKIVGAAVALLAAMGYSVGRSTVKTAQIRAKTEFVKLVFEPEEKK